VIGIKGRPVTEFLNRLPDLLPGLIMDLICLLTVACFEGAWKRHSRPATTRQLDHMGDANLLITNLAGRTDSDDLPCFRLARFNVAIKQKRFSLKEEPLFFWKRIAERHLATLMVLNTMGFHPEKNACRRQNARW
jgi:hypothetical protein